MTEQGRQATNGQIELPTRGEGTEGVTLGHSCVFSKFHSESFRCTFSLRFIFEIFGFKSRNALLKTRLYPLILIFGIFVI